MCERVVEKASWLFIYVPDHLKTQGMRNEAVEEFPFLMKHVSDNLNDAGGM